MSGETQRNESGGKLAFFHAYKPCTTSAFLFYQYSSRYKHALVGSVFYSKNYVVRALFGLGHFLTLFRTRDLRLRYSAGCRLGDVSLAHQDEHPRKLTSPISEQSNVGTCPSGIASSQDTPNGSQKALTSLLLSPGVGSFLLCLKMKLHKAFHNLRLVAIAQSYKGSIAQ